MHGIEGYMPCDYDVCENSDKMVREINAIVNFLVSSIERPKEILKGRFVYAIY
jgi:hypothetical protein